MKPETKRRRRVKATRVKRSLNGHRLKHGYKLVKRKR